MECKGVLHKLQSNSKFILPILVGFADNWHNTAYHLKYFICWFISLKGIKIIIDLHYKKFPF